MSAGVELMKKNRWMVAITRSPAPKPEDVDKLQSDPGILRACRPGFTIWC